jgi:hypothetical protein
MVPSLTGVSVAKMEDKVVMTVLSNQLEELTRDCMIFILERSEQFKFEVVCQCIVLNVKVLASNSSNNVDKDKHSSSCSKCHVVSRDLVISGAIEAESFAQGSLDYDLGIVFGLMDLRRETVGCRVVLDCQSWSILVDCNTSVNGLKLLIRSAVLQSIAQVGVNFRLHTIGNGVVATLANTRI